jgi:ATP-dependent DNA helicase RecQ
MLPDAHAEFLENEGYLEGKLKEHFGYNDFRMHQKDIIEAVLKKEDVVAILPTGAGKSLCYQLPAVIMPGTAIVISPLISLMQDQVTSLYKNGISAAFLNSSLHFQDIQEVLNDISAYKLLYLAPERLLDAQFMNKLKDVLVSFFVIDEAHCISQWGHSFRNEYRKLSILKETFPKIPIMALTATATHDVEKDMIAQLAMPKPVLIKGSFDRPNLTIRIHPKNNSEEQLIEFLKQQNNQSGIIYASTRKSVESTYELLRQLGWSVGKYHAGLSDKERAEFQNAFLHDELNLMVATVAFGMGIHKPDIRFIVHLDMPRTIEQYYQEIGRAGRDGLPAECLMLYGAQDFFIYKFFDEKIEDPVVREQMSIKTHKINRLCTSLGCRRKELLKYFGEHFTKLECGTCDNCMDEENKIDGTIIAQKIISCIYRLNQRFGLRTVIDVLRGSKSQNILNKGLDSLSTYGILSDLSEQELRFYIDSLIRMEILIITSGEYPLLNCLDAAKDVVKGQKIIYFKKKIFASSRERKARIEKQQGVLHYHEKLYEELKKLRLETARAEHVPPFVIFSDRALQEMAVYFPKNQQEFSKINGVGPIKWTKYGEKFLEVIKIYSAPSSAPGEKIKNPLDRINSVAQTIHLFRQGKSIEEIIQQRQLARSTIISHLAEGLEKGEQMDLSSLVSIETQEAIKIAANSVGMERISPIKAILPEGVSYDEIRLVVSQYRYSRSLS